MTRIPGNGEENIMTNTYRHIVSQSRRLRWEGYMVTMEGELRLGP